LRESAAGEKHHRSVISKRGNSNEIGKVEGKRHYQLMIGIEKVHLRIDDSKKKKNY